MQRAKARQNGRGEWLYKQAIARGNQILLLQRRLHFVGSLLNAFAWNELSPSKRHRSGPAETADRLQRRRTRRQPLSAPISGRPLPASGRFSAISCRHPAILKELFPAVFTALKERF